MKWLILALALIVNNAHAQSIKATGYGANYNEALQSAKTTAAEQATSTFVTGKRELTNGVLSENTAQYNGALIDSVDVKSVEVKDGIFEVQIIANVSTNKVNSFVVPEQTQAPEPAQVDKLVAILDDRQKVIDALANINSVTHPFVVKSFSANEYKTVNDSIEITHHVRVEWNTKWVDDVLMLVKSINQPLSAKTQAVICIDDACYSVPALPKKFEKFVAYNIVEHRNGSDNVVAKSMFFINDNYGRGRVKLWEYKEDTHVIWRTFSIGLTPVVPTLQIWTKEYDEQYDVSKISSADLKHITGFTYVIDHVRKYK